MMDQLPQERLKRNVVRGRLDVIGELYIFYFVIWLKFTHYGFYYSFTGRYCCIICWSKYTKFIGNNLLFYITYAQC